MSLTPDYFISDDGYPKLNREKFKLPPASSKTVTETRKPVGISKDLMANGMKEFVSVQELGISITCDKQKLLTRRSVGLRSQIHMPIGLNWASDKERKCFLNQQIKEKNSTSNNSNQQLDNRLNYRRRYSNKIFGHNQTEKMVLPELEI